MTAYVLPLTRTFCQRGGALGQSDEEASMRETLRRSPVLLAGVRSLREQVKKVPFVWESSRSLDDLWTHHRLQKSGSFAQHGEDTEILRLLKNLNARGAYVDIGSNHPFNLSNTYLLYLNGWRGLCVDPLPRFRKLYSRWRPLDRFECVGVSEFPGELTLHEFQWDVLSTFDSKLAKSYESKGFQFIGDRQVPVFRIDQLLERNAIEAPISLLSIDIEGFEIQALRSIDLERWRPSLICLEVVTADGERNAEAMKYLSNHGYSVRSDIGYNLLFERSRAS